MTPRDREYLRTHPWLRFEADLSGNEPELWVLLTRCLAGCRQVERAILPESAWTRLRELYVTKGAHATTAIEGNTLSEAEVEQARRGALEVPPSREFLLREVENVLRGLNAVLEEVIADPAAPLTPAWIRRANAILLDGLEGHLDPGVVPGEIRRHSVVVGRYRGAPHRDCAHLLERLCRMVETGPAFGHLFPDERENRRATALVHAVLAHLHLAWIHPFGDGNGRTARLIEYFLLVRGGVPGECAHLLSDHYHRTRPEYYRALDRSSRARQGPGDPLGFQRYALRGFVDGLDEQIAFVERIQERIAWDSFVRETVQREPGPAAVAQRRALVAGALAGKPTPVTATTIPALSPDLARIYGRRSRKTLHRDLRWLVERGLIAETPAGFRARTDRLRGPTEHTLPPIEAVRKPWAAVVQTSATLPGSRRSGRPPDLRTPGRGGS